MTTYLIPQDRIAELETTIARLAKRAARLGTTPIALTVAETVTEVPYVRVGEIGESDTYWRKACATDDVLSPELAGRVRYRAFRNVEVNGATPRLAGWEFIATIQHMEGEGGERVNMLRVVPGIGDRLPVRFRTAGPENCDHCHRSIKTRRDTFIVRRAVVESPVHGDSGGRALCGADASAGVVGQRVTCLDCLHLQNSDGYQQIGRTCTQDFLGGVDPRAVAAQLESLLEACGAADSMEGDDGWGGGGGGRFSGGWPIREFLSVTAALVRSEGWVSRGQARDRDGLCATADSVLYYLDPPRNAVARADHKRFVEAHPVTDADLADADAALEYARGELAEHANLSDYLWNLRVSCSMASVDHRTAGITASLVQHWRREIARRVETATRALRPSEHVGAVGERLRLRLTLASVRPIEGMYTSYLHKFRTDDDDALCWFASDITQDLPGGVRGELVIGQSYWIRGSVKAHNDSPRFGRETLLTRCTVISDEDVAAEDAKAARKAARDAKKAAKAAVALPL